MGKSIKFKKNLIFKRVLFLILLAIAFYVIFNFSAQNGEMSGSLSQKVTEFIVKIVSKKEGGDKKSGDPFWDQTSEALL